jgi:hypothetical protein
LAFAEGEATLRRIAVLSALSGLIAAAALAGCSTDEIADKAHEVRSSADAIGSAVNSPKTKAACRAAHDSLSQVGSLAGRLAADPTLARQLSGQVSTAVGKLRRAVAAAAPQEWEGVLDSTGDLGSALRDANEASVRVTAAQVVVAVKVAQAGCAVATR